MQIENITLKVTLQLQMFETDFRVDSPSTMTMEYFTEEEDKECQMPCNPIILFIVLGFTFILVGITSLVFSYQQNSISIPLSQNGNMIYGHPTYTSFNSDSMVAIYLKIQTLTQYNHFACRPRTEIESFTPTADVCNFHKFNKNINKTISIAGTKLDPNGYAIPCGYYASMFPSGTITITTGNKSMITVDQTELTVFDYEVDNFNPNTQWVDLTSQPFQSWMEQNAIISLTKLIGKVKGKFEGLLQIQFELSNGFPFTLEGAEIILTGQGSFGNSNIAFCAINFGFSAMLFIFALSVFLYNKAVGEEIRLSQMQSHQIEIRSQSDVTSVKTGYL